MKLKTFTATLALCIAATAIGACSDTSKTTSTKATEATNATTIEETEETEVTTAESTEETIEETEAAETESTNNAEDDIQPNSDQDAFDAYINETMDFYAKNLSNILNEIDSSSNSHKIMLTSLGDSINLLIWCDNADGDVYVISKLDSGDTSTYNATYLFSSRNEIDLFTEGVESWIGGDCDGGHQFLYSYNYAYDDISDSERNVTEEINQIDINHGEDETSFEGFKLAYSTYKETLDDNGDWVKSDVRYFVYYDEEYNPTEEPQEVEEKYYPHIVMAQMADINQSVLEITNDDLSDTTKLAEDLKTAFQTSFPTDYSKHNV